eukprot:1161623-Pelagomonas_calceolata.AAC.11
MHACTHTRSYTASLEALLIGHEDWVHSVCWQPELHHHPQQQQPGLPHSSSSSSSTDGVAAGSTALAQGSSSAWGGAATERSAACLLTASMDRTMVLWKYEVGGEGAVNFAFDFADVHKQLDSMDYQTQNGGGPCRDPWFGVCGILFAWLTGHMLQSALALV